MNEDVIKSAGLEIFCLTGTLPNMNNLRYKNSFRDEFNDTKYKYPITNPPYGGDKNKKSTAQEKRDKIKEYIKKDLINITDEGIRIARQKQLKDIEKQEKIEKKDNNKTKVCLENCSGRIQKYAYYNKLKGNDKEACSLILLMDILEVGGTAIGVLKEGVFFNSSYKDLRKCLIEKYNVREIISVPSDQFENTSTKTSIIIFDNIEEKTSEVKFYDLVVERFTEDKFIEKNGNIFIVQNKGDISGVSDTLVSVASREEILSNPIYSLNGKDYNKKVIVCGEGYELVRLGDVCKCLTTTKHCTNIGKKEGKYKFYNSSQDSKLYVDFCEVKDYSIILGQGGNFNIHIDKNFTPSKHVCVIQPNSANDILLNYLYYIIPELQKSFITNGSTISWLNKTNIRDFKIPIPKSEQKIIEWVEKISKPYDEKNSKHNKIRELEEYVQNKIKDITENEECEEVELGSICEINNKNIKRYDTSYNDNNGKYRFHTGCTNGTYYCNNYNIDKYTIIFNKTNGSGKCNIFLDKYISCAKQTYICQSLNDEKETQYIYYYLLDKIKELERGYIGACHKNLSFDFLQKFKIKIPNNKQLIKDLEPIFEEIEKLQGEVGEAETLYNNLIKELSDEAIPKTSVIKELTKENIDTFEEITEVKEEKVPSIKSSVASGTSIKSLKEQCKSLGIKGYSNKKKEELIKLIENHK
jgi:restriction endonuclease S subunit